MHCYSWCSSLFDSWPHGLTFLFSPSRPVIMWRLLIECQQSNSWSESVSNASDDIVHQQSELMFHNFALGSGETSFDRWSVLMPLIHPVTLKSFHSVTFCYRSVSTGDGGPVGSNHFLTRPPARQLKTHHLETRRTCSYARHQPPHDMIGDDHRFESNGLMPTWRRNIMPSIPTRLNNNKLKKKRREEETIKR